ncbi:OsmC family protein [Flavihumibacter sp. R14]|nr:OsmC family protein [Flavihumibacter soli]
MKIEITRINDAVHFEASASSSKVKVQIEGSPAMGGHGQGVRPMELVLMALASCTSLDLVQILRKQRQIIEDMSIIAEGVRTDKIPQVFTSIHLTIKLKGDIDQTKAERAAELAVKKYCSVHDMLAAGGVDITYSILLNE